ncbi:hypothetical protein HDV02_000172 [Globomyces sp. JEL0801]|nr:hypothetical protein HDV02_000172 [Globomyces sp. JEL0801]
MAAMKASLRVFGNSLHSLRTIVLVHFGIADEVVVVVIDFMVAVGTLAMVDVVGEDRFVVVDLIFVVEVDRAVFVPITVAVDIAFVFKFSIAFVVVLKFGLLIVDGELPA